ncbi:MAG: hypothetical protein B7Z62_00275 [Deltaproteobacteria bacterium 37-65-8]|nr:MAG: hypothetical protein B7Z62_00275 [Deltaproteobacteria bacterium 37-65-8]
MWESHTKRSTWFPTPDIDPAAYPRDTYFGCGTRPAAARLGATKRGGNAIISGIGALWLDIDLAGPAHQKDHLPPDQETAIALLDNAYPSIPPSAIVHSGHGLQVWYYISGWTVIDDANRIAISTLLADWNGRWRQVCTQAGYDADSVCDLSRVMRLPGTRNHKLRDDIAPVTLIYAEDTTRYTLRSLRHAAGPPRTAATRPQTPLPAPDPRPVAQTDAPPDLLERISFLTAIDPAIQATWDYHNPALRDQSPSAYDMSMAQYCIRAGFAQDDTQTILRALRSRHSAQAKPDTYYQATVAKAAAEAACTTPAPQTATSPAGTDAPKAPRFACPEDAWQLISNELTIEVTGLTRLDAEEPAYELHLATGTTVHFGCIDHLTSQTKARNLIAATTGILPPKKSAARWENIIRVALSFVVHDTAGYETTIRGQMRDWLSAYLRNTPTAPSMSAALQAAAPWTDPEGRTLLTAASLRYWIAIHYQERVAPRTLGLALRAIGATAIALPAGSPSSSAWILPKEYSQ